MKWSPSAENGSEKRGAKVADGITYKWEYCFRMLADGSLSTGSLGFPCVHVARREGFYPVSRVPNATCAVSNLIK